MRRVAVVAALVAVTMLVAVASAAGAGGSTVLADPAAPGDTNIMVTSTTPFGATTLAAAASAGSTNIKVSSVAGFYATTLAAPASAGDTNVKVASVQDLSRGQQINVGQGASAETGLVIVSVGTPGASGTGVTLGTPLPRRMRRAYL